jgi:hypothetical protein
LLPLHDEKMVYMQHDALDEYRGNVSAVADRRSADDTPDAATTGRTTVEGKDRQYRRYQSCQRRDTLYSDQYAEGE